MISNLNTLIDVEQQAKRVIEGLLASGMTELQGIFQKHHDEKVAILNAAEQQRDALKKRFIELQSNADASYKEFEQNHMELQHLVGSMNFVEFSKYLVSSCLLFFPLCCMFTQKEEHFNFVINHENKVRRELTTEKEAIVNGIQSSRQTLANSTDKYEKLTSTLSGLLNEMKTLVDKTRVESVTKLKTVHSNLENVETQIKTNCANHISAFDEFKNQMSNRNTTITTNLDKCLTVAKQIQTTEAEMVRVSNENEERLLAGLDGMDKTFEVQKNSLADKVNVTFHEVENTCEITRLDIDGGLNGLVNDVTMEQKRFDANHFEFDDSMNTLQSTQNEFHDTLNADIEFCQKRLQQFENEELQMYTPTGQTPSKREYKYPKVLAVTSPHGKIIKDFWSTHNPADLDCSAIISEVNERFFF